MKLLNYIADLKAEFSFKYAFVNRNFMISITTFFFFSLYYVWVHFMVANFVVDSVTYGNPYDEKKVVEFLSKYPQISLYQGLYSLAFFVSTFLFFFLHRNWNYNAIMRRRYVEIISKFLILWILSNAIRGIMVAYLPNEQSIKQDFGLCCEIYLGSDTLDFAYKYPSHVPKSTQNAIERMKEVIQWAEHDVNKARLLIFFLVGISSNIFSICNCFLFGIWGYISKKYSIPTEDASQSLVSGRKQVEKGKRSNKIEYRVLLTALFLIFQLILVNGITDKLPADQYVLIFLITSLGSLFLFNLNVQTSLKILRNQEYLAGIFWSLVLIFAITFAEDVLHTTITFRKIFSIQGQLFKYNFLLCIISFTVGYAKRTEELFEEKIKAVIRQKDLEIEANNLEIEAKKSQIDAHFIYNGLNFIRSKSLPFSKELSDAVVLFAAIMRYSLEGATREESPENLLESTVPLVDELEHLRNYIAFNQLRFSNELQIKYEQDGNGRRLRILPLILINYVENAMKYGVLDDAQYPVIVRVKIEQNQLILYVNNKKSHDKGVVSTQKGNEITQRRLELAYPKAHNLKIVDESDFYTLSLTIQL